MKSIGLPPRDGEFFSSAWLTISARAHGSFRCDFTRRHFKRFGHLAKRLAIRPWSFATENAAYIGLMQARLTGEIRVTPSPLKKEFQNSLDVRNEDDALWWRIVARHIQLNCA